MRPAASTPISSADRAASLRFLAQIVRNNPSAREAIANGFELIADCMEPCEDCGAQPLLDDLVNPPLSVTEIDTAAAATDFTVGGTD